ncbi:MAG: RNA-directed DNA polymerase [Planctomycetes bacterium]|nr:RNA-directed DNA polymerase [Planctomycetota bacterium]
MGLWDQIRKILQPGEEGPDVGRDVAALARLLEVAEESLRALRPAYQEFAVPKRSGGTRTISAPEPELKALQRRILRRALARLKSHPAAKGFERGLSIVDNARPHAGKAVVVRMDLKEFFPSTRLVRVEEFFHRAGWNRDASRLLARLTTHRGGLPQGAPTSPKLANLVNRLMDVRLSRLAERLCATYTRYADDLTFSFAQDVPEAIHDLVARTKVIVDEFGYEIHHGKKLRIRRQHQRQLVTGLVVNDGIRLPRTTRRWLRAVEHRAKKGGDPPPTLTAGSYAGWMSFVSMVERQVGKG